MMLDGCCHNFDFGLIGNGTVGMLAFVLNFTQQGTEGVNDLGWPIDQTVINQVNDSFLMQLLIFEFTYKDHFA